MTEHVAFDLGDLDDGMLDEMDERLDEAGITHGWDDAVTLVVAAADADRAEEVLRAVEFPDELAVEADVDDGLVEVLSDIFLAADTLARDPAKASAVAGLHAAVERSRGRRPPFGIDPDLWAGAQAQAQQLVTLVVEEAAPETIVETARELRDRLRPIV